MSRFRLLNSEPTFLAESLAVFAAMTKSPSSTRKALIDTTIRRLVAAGAWARLDGLVVVDGTYPVPRFINWRNPAVVCNIQNTPDLAPDKGSTGDGVAAEGVRTFWNPATQAGALMTASSMMMGVFTLSDSNIEGFDIGCAASLQVSASYSDSKIHAHMGSGTAILMAVDNSVGFTLANRDGTQVTLTRDDFTGPAQTVAVGAIASNNITIGYRSTLVSDRREFAGFWGLHLTSTQMINDFYSILFDYFTAVNGVYEISVTINEPSGGVVTEQYRVFNDGTALLSGTMIGTALDIDVEVTTAVDPSTPVVAYTTVDTGVSTGNWSGSLSGIPPGSSYKARARLSDLTAVSPRIPGQFGVGLNVAITGDSNGIRQWSITDATLPRPVRVGDVRRYSGGGYPNSAIFGGETPDVSHGGWSYIDLPKQSGERGGPYGGDAGILCGNYLTALQPTWSFGFLQLGAPGSAASEWTNGGQATPFLLPAGDNLWDVLNAHLIGTYCLGAPQWSQVGIVCYWGGVTDTDIDLAPSAAAFETTMDTMLSQLRAATGNAALPLTIHSVGSTLGAGDINNDDASVNAVRQGALNFWDNNKADGVYMVGTSVVYTREDDVGHWISLHQRYAGVLQARAIAYAMGWVANGAEGSRINTATATGSTITITVTHAGGTLIQGLTGSTGLTGWRVQVDSVARNITSAVISAGTLQLTVDGTAFTGGNVVEFDYLYGRAPDVSNAVFDDDAVCTDAFPGIPLQPSRLWVTATVI